MVGTGKTLGALCALTLLAAAAPGAAAASTHSVSAAVRTIQGQGASASAAGNLLMIADDAGIDNRISAYIDGAGRLVLTAPEGLRDPDGSAANCKLEGANTGESNAQQVSCAPGYIAAIVGTLGRGDDVFDADPALDVGVGTETNGTPRPFAGGPGHDRLVGGAARDLLQGDAGPDSIVGGGDKDLLVGGSGADNLSGAGGSDRLLGLAGNDRLNGGAARDVCKGGPGRDSDKNCETSRGIP